MDNQEYKYGYHKGKEVEEHVNQELNEMGYTELQKSEFWQGLLDYLGGYEEA